jgi:hypothetical protein
MDMAAVRDVLARNGVAGVMMEEAERGDMIGAVADRAALVAQELGMPAWFVFNGTLGQALPGQNFLEVGVAWQKSREGGV